MYIATCRKRGIYIYASTSSKAWTKHKKTLAKWIITILGQCYFSISCAVTQYMSHIALHVYVHTYRYMDANLCVQSYIWRNTWNKSECICIYICKSTYLERCVNILIYFFMLISLYLYFHSCVYMFTYLSYLCIYIYDLYIYNTYYMY